jgi:hypothetical protein
MSTVHAIAPDDVVRRHADRAAGARVPLLVLEPLEANLDAHGLGAGDLEVEPLGEGHSNVTYALRRDGADLVLRRPPRPPLPPSAHDVLREARVLRALKGRARVPEVLAACADESVIGAPFYVMPRLAGEVVTAAVPAGSRVCGSTTGHVRSPPSAVSPAGFASSCPPRRRPLSSTATTAWAT